MNKSKQIKLLIIVLAMIFINMTSVFAQSTCSTPTNVVLSSSTATLSASASASEYWFSFVADNDILLIEVEDANYNITQIDVYEGSCNALIQINSSSINRIGLQDLIPGKTYTGKLSSSNSDGDFSLLFNLSYPTIRITKNNAPNHMGSLDKDVCEGDVLEISAHANNLTGITHYCFFIDGYQTLYTTTNSNHSNHVQFIVPNMALNSSFYITTGVSYNNGITYDSTFTLWSFGVNRKKLIYDEAPNVTFTPTPNPACPLEIVSLGISCTNYSGGWGDGATIASNFGYISHAYAESGIYDVSIEASNQCGSNTSQNQVSVTITPDFSFSNTCVGNGVQFTSESTCSSVIGDWYWDFGDATGIFSNSMQNPSHTYNTPGTYNVTLRLVTNYNAPSTGLPEEFSITKQIIIYPKPAVANIIGINNRFFLKKSG